MENKKRNTATKTCMKKAVDAKKKAQKKLDQAKKNARFKEQGVKMRKLALVNCQTEFSTFKTGLSNPLTGNNFLASISLYIAPSFITSSLPVSTIRRAQAAKLEKKKAMTAASAQKLGHLTEKDKRTAKRKRISIPLPVLMELIRPNSKRKVRVMSIAAETTPLHCMRRAEADDVL